MGSSSQIGQLRKSLERAETPRNPVADGLASLLADAISEGLASESLVGRDGSPR